MKTYEINGKTYYIKEAGGFIYKFKGFMLKKNIDFALLFKNTNGIHTFFMLEPIDVVLFDKDYNILFIIENLKPWRVIFPKKSVKHTLELPNGHGKFIKQKNPKF